MNRITAKQVLPFSEDEEIGLDASQHNEKYMQVTLLIHNNGKLEEKLADEIK